MTLRHKNNWELLVAVILSAKCTDKRVNIITNTLFKKYKTLDDYVHATPVAFEKMIRSCTYFRNKTRNILAAAKVQENVIKFLEGTIKKEIYVPGKLVSFVV